MEKGQDAQFTRRHFDPRQGRVLDRGRRGCFGDRAEMAEPARHDGKGPVRRDRSRRGAVAIMSNAASLENGLE